MSLELLRIYNARNLTEYSLSPHPFFNIIYGANGAGKTTILESIYLLLRSRTFRSSKYKSFIQHDYNTCTVFSRFTNHSKENDQKEFSLGISRSRDSSHPVLHLNSEKINSLSIITNLVVLGLITPESFSLLDAGPAIRRKFIDWGVFHVEHDFLSTWRSYKKNLSNRNSILKQVASNYKNIKFIPKSELDKISCWSPQLVLLNEKLHLLRSKQIEYIRPVFFQYLNEFSPELCNKISLNYYRGWSKDLSFDQYLQQKLPEDLFAGTTRFGTHRSELRINYNNNLAKDVLSRGQKKILVICLILAQYSFLINQENNPAHNILLMDDIDSELDDNNLAILFKLLDSLHSQVLVTTTDKQKFNFIDKENLQMFHVEQ